MSIKSFICGVAGQALTTAEREFLQREQPYGVILFARNIDNPAQVQTLVADIKSCLTHPFAQILIDQEGGRVARMKPPHWRVYPPAFELAQKPDASRAIYLNARLIAQELQSVGITTDCAPLADVLAPECHAIIGDRAFGRDGGTVATLARAQAQGLLDGGILPVLKHIPGHGRATMDSHEALPVVSATLDELAACDFIPFALLADLPLGMTAHIVYTALDADRVATCSPTVIQFIRQQIGFGGLLMSDDLSMKALGGSYEERTEKTLAAGCDLALHCNGVMDEMQAVAAKSVALAGEALARAERAQAMLPTHAATPEPTLLAEWQRLLAAA
ncbi:MAG: beta-N-acetylhexosaminidase [Rickettsiales bacterium]